MSELVYDGHIHMADRPVNVPDFLNRIHSAGIDGGLVISVAPAGLPDAHGANIPAKERMIGVRDFCEKCGKNFYPCFWIDVLEKDAVEQVKMAKEMGYKTVFWSLAYKDYNRENQPGKEYVIDHFKTYHHNGAIVLMHNDSLSNLEAVEDVIVFLKENGYRFGVLDEIQ